MAPSLGEFQYDMASKQPAVIEVPDDDFPDSGPQNPVEAQSYRNQLDAIMSTFSNLLADDLNLNFTAFSIAHHTKGDPFQVRLTVSTLLPQIERKRKGCYSRF